MNEPRKIIPKTEFKKLRQTVLAHLKRNGDANGWAHLRHDQLEWLSRIAKDLRPFVGMAPVWRSHAITFFWETLLKAGDVVKAVDPLDADGKLGPAYALPGVPAFAPNVGVTMADVAALVMRLTERNES